MARLEGSTTSIERAHEDFFGQKYLQEQCTEESLTRLQEAFLASEDERMSASQLYDAFKDILVIYIPEQKFNILFKKINLKQDGYVNWDEFVSYLLLEFQEKDVRLQLKVLELPIRGAPQLLKSHHRTAICRIAFCPEISANKNAGFSEGHYVTAGRDGIINFWSLDLEYERSVQAKNPNLKVQPTTITDMIVMPDIQILGTSSTEYDLRFYDYSAKKFDLRILTHYTKITGLKNAVVSMSYYYNTTVKQDSVIVLGDMGGSVTIMTFDTTNRGPFKQNTERELSILHYDDMLKGGWKEVNVIEMKHVHSDWVSQVSYFGSLKCFMSSSRCSNCSLLLSDPTGTRTQYVFKVKRGISCFTFCEDSQMLVTGGSDCIVRIWNPFVPRRANAVFQGHHAVICAIVIQDDGKHIYSLSKDRCVKVWDVISHTCIQTYNGLPSELGEYTPLTIVYNTLMHKMIVAGMMIATIICDPVINPETSDGFTHTQPVSCVLFNRLYKVVVTTGWDSCIIVWDPWRGRRLYLITNAHNRLLYGQYTSVAITAASFDDSKQLLVTGARDGTLKVWNFNTGTCIRNMSIELQREVTSVVWVENRIICSGWNRQVIEFALTETYIHKKNWGIKHTEEILCSAVHHPQVLATATYNGEIILWRLETGQPFRIFKVNDPIARYAISYVKDKTSKLAISNTKTEMKKQESIKKSMLRKASAHQTSILKTTRTVSVQAIIFLRSRKPGPRTGTMLASLDSGLVQVWSHHPAGGFLEAFSVIHGIGDCALALGTDPQNCFLVTGHRAGYLKVWLLTNYLIPDPPTVSMPLLRLEFPFLWKDRINGRAKRAVRDQPLPLLLCSVKGHTSPIKTVEIIPDPHIIISGSVDRTVRVWSLGGRYISTLGSFRPWTPILPTIPVYKYFEDYRWPCDIKRSASYTTMKVLEGGNTKTSENSTDFESKVSGGKTKRIIPKQYQDATFQLEFPILDNSLPYIPIYTHLTTHSVQDIMMTEVSLPQCPE